MQYATKFEAITGHVTDDGTLLVLSHQIARPVSKNAPRSLTCVQGFGVQHFSAVRNECLVCALATDRV